MQDDQTVTAVELLQSLDAGTIEERIDALDAEQQALRTLLRPLRARDRARRRSDPDRGPEGVSQ